MSVRFRRVIAPALIAAAAALACDETTPPEQEPEVATMRLTVGSATIDVEEDGTVTGGPITISGNTSISAAWLKADGTAEDLVTGADFELTVEIANEAFVTFTRTGPFAGTLNRVAAGTTTATLALLHIEEQHEDFGPFPVSIVVN
jgi:hypothetical protein